MALVDDNGQQTIGGIQKLRDEFISAAGGHSKVSNVNATLEYVEGNAQVIRFTGHKVAGSEPFDVTSDSIQPGASLTAIAGSLAQGLFANG